MVLDHVRCAGNWLASLLEARRVAVPTTGPLETNTPFNVIDHQTGSPISRIARYLGK
jgi:hypothetical protein